MDSESMNHYEQQLYSVFKTFDVENEEALDKCAVVQLCDALQLDDRGGELVDTLFERRADRVTFAQFRNGLLAVLGGNGDATTTPTVQPEPPPPSDLSDEDSCGREVAPKFVFGSKKYGRRSRPQRTDETPGPRSSSASRVDNDDKRVRQRPRCRRSTSAMETRDENITPNEDDAAANQFDHDKRIDQGQALALCRDLHMEGIDHRLVESIFESSQTADTTVGEFFDRLNASLTTSMEKTRGDGPTLVSRDVVDDEAVSGVASDLVVEAWERAGVRRPRRLLAELGFGAATLRPPELERAIDEELRALAEPPAEGAALLLAAAFALGRLRLSMTRRRADVAVAERDKLRIDLAEANRRALVLAQEVDESQTRLESELRANLRRSEARHAEAARLAAVEAGAERERWAAARAGLEAEVARRAELEARLRAEAAALLARADEAEARCAGAERRLAEAERERARVASDARGPAAAPARAGDAGAAADAEWASRLDELRRENQQLRDRNDELCAELERARVPGGLAKEELPRSGDLSVELSLLIPGHMEDCGSPPVSIEQSVPQQAVTGPPAASHAAVQTDAALGSSEELLEAERRHDEDKDKLVDLVNELEWSLEQMRGEYERCEEYWAGKLREERAEHEAEARAADGRLAELAARVADYERRFAPALPPIDEARALEAQFAHLEGEFAQYRAQAERALAAERAQLARLRAAPAPAPPPAPAPAPAPAPPPAHAPAEERELRGRLQRAEAAVRRLHARLAAADLMVKDLYVENCQLAHRRAL